MRNRSRPAFSLIELLVLIAILALLLGLLLPAVAKVRMARDRVQSQNNLRQIALAVHNYASANNAFPAGTDAKHFSAAARLLPYLEQDNLYKQIDFDKPITDEANAAARKARVPVFLSADDPVPGGSDAAGPTNYLFNAGSKPGLEDNDGAFYLDSKITFADITDGTSNTVLAGETLKGAAAKPPDVRRQYVRLKKDALKDINDEAGVKDFAAGKHLAGDRGASWMDGRFLQGTFTGTRAVNDQRPDVSCDGAGGLSGLRSLRDVANIAMCDGSARTVRQNTKAEVWKLLTSRNDGQVLPGDF